MTERAQLGGQRGPGLSGPDDYHAHGTTRIAFPLWQTCRASL
jgi:hypothetical protein